MIIQGPSQYLLDEGYADLGADDIPNAIAFVNPDVGNVVAVNAELDNGDSFLPTAIIPLSDTPGRGTIVAPGGTVTIEINTRGVATGTTGNLIVSCDGGAVYFTPVVINKD